jgi:hypothetical protein
MQIGIQDGDIRRKTIGPIVAGTAPDKSTGQHDPACIDFRFRSLLAEADWRRLPVAVRRRFSKRLSANGTAVYTGRVTEVAISGPGRLLVQAARLIGAPLPLSRDVDVPAVVTVTEDARDGGQVWTRLYARRGRLPQIIHSRKRFAGDTGLEEHVGGGVGMSLTLTATRQALVFTSRRYFIATGRHRLYVPRWLSPGVMTLAHTEIDATHFAFTLDLHHPWLGTLVHQRVVFTEFPT